MYNIYKIVFKEGKEAIWITDQCPTLEDALMGAFEKFGQKRVKHVIKNNQQEEANSTTCPNLTEEEK